MSIRDIHRVAVEVATAGVGVGAAGGVGAAIFGSTSWLVPILQVSVSIIFIVKSIDKRMAKLNDAVDRSRGEMQTIEGRISALACMNYSPGGNACGVLRIVEGEKMSSSFEVAYRVLHGHEIGLVTEEQARRIHDSGGVTKDGVSLRYLREKGFDVNGDGVIDAKDIMALTPEQIKYACLKDFWRPIYEELAQPIATKVYDTAVNMGTHEAHVLAQNAAIDCGRLIDVDGDFGPKTRDAINSILPNVFLRSYCRLQTAYYEDVFRRKPGMEPCRAGWLARAAWPFTQGGGALS